MAAKSNADSKKKYDGKWYVPHKRAEGFAKDRKKGVHTYGEKEGQELSPYEKGLRSGYLMCQTDHAGIYKYQKAIAEGKTKAEAREISRRKSKKG